MGPSSILAMFAPKFKVLRVSARFVSDGETFRNMHAWHTRRREKKKKKKKKKKNNNNNNKKEQEQEQEEQEQEQEEQENPKQE